MFILKPGYVMFPVNERRVCFFSFKRERGFIYFFLFSNVSTFYALLIRGNHCRHAGERKKVIVECVFALWVGDKLIAADDRRTAMCLDKVGAKTMTQLALGSASYVNCLLSGIFVWNTNEVWMQLRVFLATVEDASVTM